MRRLARIMGHRIRSIFRGPRVDNELGRELEIHLEQLTKEYRAQGMSERDAANAARRAFGSIDVTAERCRDQRRIRFLESTFKDLQYALRLLAKSPGFSLLAIFTLALGIGAVTMMFSVIYNVLLNPFPYTDPRRMVDVVIQNTNDNSIRGDLTTPEFRTFVDESGVFEDAVGTFTSGMLYRSGEGVEQFYVAALTPNSFRFLGVPALLGRTIQDADAATGAPPVGVLSYKTWMTYFGGDAAVLGRSIILDNRSFTVIGVMPPRFTWNVADVWIPDPADRRDPDGMNKGFWLQARLKPGLSLLQAQSELNLIGTRLAALYPNRYPKQFKVVIIPVIDWVVGRFRSVLYTLFGAVGLVLLIACCNVANMLLARGTARAREIAIRSALGGSRFQIMRQMLVESMLLAVSGGVLGVLLAYGGLPFLRQLVPLYGVPVETEIGIAPSVLAFSVAIAMLTALVFGIAPAMQSTRRDVAKGLAGSTKGGDGGAGRGTLRNVLVVCEVSLSLVLLSGAAVLMQSFMSLTSTDLGFNPQNVLMTRTNLPNSTAAERRQFLENALQRLASLSGVTAAGISSGFPAYGAAGTNIELAGQDSRQQQNAQFELCNDTYFQLMGFRLLSGVPLDRADVAAGRKVAVVNETLSKKYFGNANPLGKQIRITRLGTGRDAIVDPAFVIIGVIQDIRNRGLEEPVQPAAFIPYTTFPGGFPRVLIRTATDPRLLARTIRQEIRAVNGSVVQRDPIILEDALTDRSYARPRFSVMLMAVFGAIGLILVGTGVYGVMAYVVSRQTQEIGIRMALGAQQSQVFRSVFANAFRLIAIGVVLGAISSVAMNRIIANQVWTVRMFDPLGFGAAVALIAVLGGVACLRPALRATRVDPVLALRQS